MARIPGFFLFSMLVYLHTITSTVQTCETRYCGDPELGPSIQYPFYLKEVESDDCGYPNFGVFCDDRNQTLITLGNAGDFVVKEISLEDHQAWMNDPNHCLPSRFIHDLDLQLQSSPFRWSTDYSTVVNVDFLNCTTPVPDSAQFAHKIPCLSSSDSDNLSVIAVLSDPAFPTTSMSFPGCGFISSSLVPVDSFGPEQLWKNLYSDMRLKWNNQPNCILPANLDPDNQHNACYENNLLNPDGDPPHYKIYKILVVGVTGAVCFCVAGLARLLCAEVEPNGLPRRRMNVELERNTAESVDVAMGLDESTIEQYPKTQVGHSGKLPNPSDNVCSICLSEYEPLETLRTIPHCNHYFHAHCIDGWLKKKGTCPLCRHLPHGSS
ncbi:putative RING-H2 finger protein ATL21A [Prosopis cineraria]|uniref:putative RING-H2 finger protein ATL21A n=1 Tax=Prosopis cineraria TaxID=364024 RepID=UPI00240EE7B0|nr:putative RING-H2 finger protein ATL21A [Prosopis cineraria]